MAIVGLSQNDRLSMDVIACLLDVLIASLLD